MALVIAPTASDVLSPTDGRFAEHRVYLNDLYETEEECAAARQHMPEATPDPEAWFSSGGCPGGA